MKKLYGICIQHGQVAYIRQRGQISQGKDWEKVNLMFCRRDYILLSAGHNLYPLCLYLL